MNITELTHLIVGKFLSEGDIAVDATVGNGHDTLFLARKVGVTGRVIGFDVQEAALAAARERLEHTEKNLLERVTFLRLSHAKMENGLAKAGVSAEPKAILFNLGYLPGGDKSVTTETEETLEALKTALRLLAPGGVLTAVLYAGHPEGERESAAVLEWAKGLPEDFRVYCTTLYNRSETAPKLIAIEKFR